MGLRSPAVIQVRSSDETEAKIRRAREGDQAEKQARSNGSGGTIEKIGKTPDTKSKSNSRREVGRERQDNEILTQDAAKGTPVAGNNAPIEYPHILFDRQRYAPY